MELSDSPGKLTFQIMEVFFAYQYHVHFLNLNIYLIFTALRCSNKYVSRNFNNIAEAFSFNGFLKN